MQVVFKNDTRSCGSCHWGRVEHRQPGQVQPVCPLVDVEKRVDHVLVKGEADARAKD